MLSIILISVSIWYCSSGEQLANTETGENDSSKVVVIIAVSSFLAVIVCCIF